MGTQANDHLNADRILRAVIDAGDLTGAERAHLSRCQPCRNQVARMTADLTRIGRRAAQYSPLPQRPVSLPVETATRRRWRFALVPAAVAAAALIMAIWWNGPEIVTVDGPNLTISALEENGEPESEMQVVSDNALPDVFLEIIGDEETGFSEEFMEFVVPDPDADNDSLSEKGKEIYHV